MNISLRQFCAIIGCSMNTARTHIQKSRLMAQKVSGQYVVSMDELRRIQSEGFVPPSDLNLLTDRRE